MSAIGPTGAAGTQQTQNSSQQTSAGNLTGLNQNQFLQLLVSQMQNQNPLNPTSSNQFLQEMASFTQVVDLGQIQQLDTSLLTNEVANQGLLLLGKTVTAVDQNGKQISGTVSQLTMVGGQPMLTVGQSQVPVSSVISVQS